MEREKEPEAPAGLGHTGEEMHLLRELMRTSQAAIHVMSREVGMPGARLALLRLLAVSHPTGMGTMDAARRLGVNPAAVTRNLAAMEAEGLVAREADARDARRSRAVLTAEGLSAFQELHQRAHALEERLAAGVTADEVRTAIRVLGEVRAVLESLM